MPVYSLLIADDESLERSSLRLIINKSCPEISRIWEAENGKQVLKSCREHRPDIVFLDIRMPGLSGLEAARGLREILPNVRIVFLTAYNHFEYAHEAIKIGVDDFLLKPASDDRIREVVGKIARILDGLRRREEDDRKNRDRLEKVAEFFTSEILESLLVRPVPSGTLANYFSIMDVVFTRGVVAAFRIDYGSYPVRIDSREQELLLKRRCLLAIKNEFEGRMIRFLVHELRNVFYVLVLPGKDAAEEYTFQVDILDLFQSVTGMVREDIGLSIHVGVSRSFTDPDGIHAAFREAGAALDRTGPDDTVVAWQESFLEKGGQSAAGFSPQSLQQSRGGALVKEVVDYIDGHYMENISLESLSARVHLSCFYLSKVFKHHKKVTFIDYLTDFRIGKARELLRNPKSNVKEVCYAVGYSDPNYFARVFKRIVGLTPTEFRDRTS